MIVNLLKLGDDYDNFLRDLKQFGKGTGSFSRHSRTGATLLANRQRHPYPPTATALGTQVIDSLSKDLQKEFPDIKGFSSRNLKYMQSFAEAYVDEPIVQQLAAQIPY
ncbi:DUF1016 N-terminal domain-containing protein [Tumidithrix elongata RA019]|uniref:DUF1016 N-terminal domain-containing protein n=1 Tax=Tumidithrix elongata BACA0141 TaxID=2716417 RepID=A0AAW9PR61_9CYAN|nr:DUF1016 N-terminal domain-containing protein [Tumidithrix elongata RA019]